MIKTILIFILGALVGVGVTAYTCDRMFKQYSQTLQSASLFQAREEANEAYFHQSPEIAQWELGKLLPRLRVAPSSAFDPEPYRSIAIFLTHARLAKLQQAAGKLSEAQQNLSEANKFMGIIFSKYAETKDDDVFSLLAKFDEHRIQSEKGAEQ